MTAQAGHATPDQFYEITAPGGKVHTPPAGRCWSLSKKTFEELLADGRIYFGKDNNSQPNKIRYLSEVPGVAPWTWWPSDEVGHTDSAKKEIMEIFESMHEKGRTIILVTHEPEIAACASRQLLVRDGKITRDEGKGVIMDVV